MKKKLIIVLVLLLAFMTGMLICRFFVDRSFKAMSLVYVGMGHDATERGNYLKAISYFSMAVATDQKSYIARISLSEAYLLGGHYRLAMEEYANTLAVAKEEKWNESEIRRIEEKMKRIEQYLATNGKSSGKQ